MESDGGSSLSEFADVLVDPSLISRKSSEGRHLSASSFTRSASDSAVHHTHTHTHKLLVCMHYSVNTTHVTVLCRSTDQDWRKM